MQNQKGKPRGLPPLSKELTTPKKSIATIGLISTLASLGPIGGHTVLQNPKKGSHKSLIAENGCLSHGKFGNHPNKILTINTLWYNSTHFPAWNATCTNGSLNSCIDSAATLDARTLTHSSSVRELSFTVKSLQAANAVDRALARISLTKIAVTCALQAANVVDRALPILTVKCLQTANAVARGLARISLTKIAVTFSLQAANVVARAFAIFTVKCLQAANVTARALARVSLTEIAVIFAVKCLQAANENARALARVPLTGIADNILRAISEELERVSLMGSAEKRKLEGLRGGMRAAWGFRMWGFVEMRQGKGFGGEERGRVCIGWWRRWLRRWWWSLVGLRKRRGCRVVVGRTVAVITIVLVVRKQGRN